MNGDLLKLAGAVAMALGGVLFMVFGAVGISLLLTRAGVVLPWDSATLHLHDSYYVICDARPIREWLWLNLIPLIASAVIIVSGWGMRSAGGKIEASLQRFPPEAASGEPRL
jgi:hypothetical protein